MSEFDDLEEQIETLHAEAEDLHDTAKIADAEQSEAMKREARRKVRQAARLRAQMEARG